MKSLNFCTDIDRLVEDMEAVDDALAIHLADVIHRRAHQRQSAPPLEYMRLQIKAWCAAAARRGTYNTEAVLATLMAVDQMDRNDLAALVRGLVREAVSMRQPAA